MKLRTVRIASFVLGMLIGPLGLLTGCFDYDSSTPVAKDSDPVDLGCSGCVLDQECFADGDPQPGAECLACDATSKSWIVNHGAICTSDNNPCNGVEVCNEAAQCVSNGDDPCPGRAEFCEQHCDPSSTDDAVVCQMPNYTECSSDGDSATDDYCLDGACAHPVAMLKCTDDDGKIYFAGSSQDGDICLRCDGVSGDWVGNFGVACASDGDACNGVELCTAQGTCESDSVNPCSGEAELCQQGCNTLDDQDNYECKQPDDTPCAPDSEFCTADVCLDGVCTHSTPTCAGVCDEAGGVCCVADDHHACVIRDFYSYDSCGNGTLVQSCGVDEMCVYPTSSVPCMSSFPWHLDRVNQRNLPLDGDTFVDKDGINGFVEIYVVGTGIQSDHAEFSGNLAHLESYFFDYEGVYSGEDCHGAGTHTAGLIAGANVGLQDGLVMYDTRVLNCNGELEDPVHMADGLHAILSNVTPPAVVVFTHALEPSGLGAMGSTIEAMIHNLVDLDVTVVLPAGDTGGDACQQVGPSYLGVDRPGILMVGASSATDAVLMWSNWGPCVEIFAPGGFEVVSAGTQGPLHYTGVGVTGPAAAMVAGAAASALNKVAYLPEEVEGFLLSEATVGVLNGVSGGSQNLLLYLPFH